jgi:hypothetical protein
MGIDAKPECRTRRREIDVAAIAACWLFALHLLLACGIAAAQTPGPEAPASAPANVPVPPPSGSQGFFDAFGNWMQQGVSNVGAGFGAMVGAVGSQAGQAAKSAADVARDTATSVTKLPVAGVIGGRERCILAPNGAPDCRTAAEAMCRAKGYVSGASVDFETTEKCPPPYRVSSRNTPEGVCTMEHFVTRALCQ